MNCNVLYAFLLQYINVNIHFIFRLQINLLKTIHKKLFSLFEKCLIVRKMYIRAERCNYVNALPTSGLNIQEKCADNTVTIIIFTNQFKMTNSFEVFLPNICNTTCSYIVDRIHIYLVLIISLTSGISLALGYSLQHLLQHYQSH